MEIVDAQTLNSTDRQAFFMHYCGSDRMVVTSGDFKLSQLHGYAAQENGRILGLITYEIYDDYLEIISLDCATQNKGIGTALVNGIVHSANQLKKSEIKVITTNDNINAMGAGQKSI